MPYTLLRTFHLIFVASVGGRAQEVKDLPNHPARDRKPRYKPNILPSPNLTISFAFSGLRAKITLLLLSFSCTAAAGRQNYLREF